MRIITISREFGSGGRELGKRMADETGFDYYDSEIIAAVAKGSGLDEPTASLTASAHSNSKRPIRSLCCFRGGTGSHVRVHVGSRASARRLACARRLPRLAGF